MIIPLYRVKAWLGGFCCIMLISFSLLGAASLFFADRASAALYQEMEQRLYKGFTLYGSLQLSYERSWSGGVSSQPATTEIIKSFDLGVRGFIVDPRLMNFDVSGLISGDSREDPGKSSTLTGVRLDVMLLESLPRQWLGSWMFIPNPIMLRFNHLSNTFSYTNYGITLTHRMPEEVKFSQPKDALGSRSGFPFPLTIFDYDHYDYKDDLGFKSTTNLYSLRSSIRGKDYDCSFLMEKADQTGSTQTDRFTVELQPDFSFFDPRTKSTWDIFNLLRYDKIDDTKNYQGHSSMFYRRPMGDSGSDMLLVTGNLELLKLSAEGMETATWDAFARAEYDRRFSARLLVVPFTEMGYNKGQENDTGEKETVHFERVGTRIEADLSRVFRNRSEVFIGQGQNGLEYGVNTMFATKTRINAAAGYSFSTTSLPEGRFSVHQLVLRASGPIFGNLTFDSSANYTLQDTSGQGNAPIWTNYSGGSYIGYLPSEDSLRASANLYWFFRKTSVSAGGSWMQSTTKDSLTGKTTATALQASLSQVMTTRTFFSVFSSWLKDSQKNETIEVLPRLSWTRGRTLINLDYDYRSTTTLGCKPTAEHRLFLRFIRSFSHGFKL